MATLKIKMNLIKAHKIMNIINTTQAKTIINIKYTIINKYVLYHVYCAIAQFINSVIHK